MNAVVKSFSFDQKEIIAGIKALHCPSGFDCDVTFGNGKFWDNGEEPVFKFDIDPQMDGVEASCSMSLPLADGQVNSLVFDPPFLTYVRDCRSGNGNMVMAKRFSGYWRYDELERHYKGTLKEAGRVIADGGIMVFKCQDIIHNHKMHCTHANVILWASDAGFRLKDLFVLGAAHRMPAPNRKGTQKHARIYHSYFLVFEKMGKGSRS